MKLTLRDLLWLVLTVGLVLGWWLDRERQRASFLRERRLLEHYQLVSQVNSLELADAIVAEGYEIHWQDGRAIPNKAD